MFALGIKQTTIVCSQRRPEGAVVGGSGGDRDNGQCSRVNEQWVIAQHQIVLINTLFR